MVDTYWTCKTSSKTAYSEKDKVLLKNVDYKTVEEFVYTVGTFKVKLNLKDGKVNVTQNDKVSASYKCPVLYSQVAATLFYMTRKRNGAFFQASVGYTMGGKEYVVDMDYLGKVTARGLIIGN